MKKKPENVILLTVVGEQLRHFERDKEEEPAGAGARTEQWEPKGRTARGGY